MKTQGNRENVLSPHALWGLAGPQRRRRRTSCVRRLSSFDDRQAMYEASCRYTAQASHWSLWLPSMLSRLENGCIHAQAPRIAEPKHSRQQIDNFEVTTSLRRNTVCTSVVVGYGVKMKRRLSAMCGLLLFSLRRWQRRRRSEIGCYSARRGAAFHCIAWEMFEHWRKSNRWAVRVWEFFAMKWPGLISPEKT